MVNFNAGTRERGGGTPAATVPYGNRFRQGPAPYRGHVHSTKEINMANKEQTEEKNDMPKCPYCGSDNVSYDNGSWICMDCWGEWPQDE